MNQLEALVYEGIPTETKTFVVKYIIAFQMTEGCCLSLTRCKLHTFAVLQNRPEIRDLK